MELAIWKLCRYRIFSLLVVGNMIAYMNRLAINFALLSMSPKNKINKNGTCFNNSVSVQKNIYFDWTKKSFKMMLCIRSLIGWQAEPLKAPHFTEFKYEENFHFDVSKNFNYTEEQGSVREISYRSRPQVTNFLANERGSNQWCIFLWLHNHCWISWLDYRYTWS